MIARRRFLQSAAAGTFFLPTFARSAPPPAERPSLGFSLYGMKSVPLAAALSACAEIGYSHVEPALNPGYPTEPVAFSAASRQAAARQLKELKLGVPCLMVHLNLTADDAAHAKAIELIAAAGQVGRDLSPQQPPSLETVVGGSPSQWDEQKAGMAARLRDWAAAAQAAGTIVAIKAHVGSAVNSPERLLWLLAQVPSPAVRIAYDYSHFELQGIDMQESMKLLLPRTKFIHVKDTRGDARKFQFLLPGEGRTDYVQYFRLLRQHGYTGSVCVEVSSQVSNQPGYDPIAAARKSYAALSSAIQKSML